VITTFPDATKEEVDVAIAAAHEAFLFWRRSPISTRTAVLVKAAQPAACWQYHTAEARQ
jgi:succinate-semialdehyde dehydrogenase/glutarate-semialdehyde dehydrogenase